MPACLLAALAVGTPLHGASAGDTVRGILEREHCQTELPDQADTTVSAWGPSASSGWEAPPAEPPFTLALPSFLPSVIAIVIIVTGLAVGLALLLRNLPHRLRPAEADPAKAHTEEAARPAGAPPDHERLAQEGRYAEAVHALLLRAMADLPRRAPSRAAAVAPSRTSREVLRSAALPAELQQTLAPLVTAVERVYFGTVPAGIAEYAAAVHQYRSFEAACATRA